MKKIRGLLSLAVVSGSLCMSFPAQAETYFRDDDRVILRSYVTTTTTMTTTTPPTTPTVPTIKRTVTYYTPGTVLPSTVSYTVLPSTVTTKLLPAPQNAEYAIIDGNAYLINRETRVIIDAENLLEAE